MPNAENAARPTPFPEVNAVVRELLAAVLAILRDSFTGMYLYGSLAQGDFDRDSSDIDIIVVTARAVTTDQFALLGEMHATYRASHSYWAEKVEAAYIQRDALNLPGDDDSRYPQLEKGRVLAWEPLELGWPFQRSVLREQGIVIAGPDPKLLLAPVPARELSDAALAIVRLWQEQGRVDPTWIDWVRERSAQRFVLLTLARSLHTMERGTLASKAEAARWAQATLDGRWAGLVARAFAEREDGVVGGRELGETLAFIDHTVGRLAQREDDLSPPSAPANPPLAGEGKVPTVEAGGVSNESRGENE